MTNTIDTIDFSSRVEIAQFFTKNLQVGGNTFVAGWVRSIRKAKGFCFVVLNDGSCQGNLQIVVDENAPGYEEAVKSLIGTSLAIWGEIVASPGKEQGLELKATKVVLLSATSEEYPLQKKATSLEFLREVAHLRPRTNLFAAIFRLRHVTSLAIHEFFDSKGFYYLNSPILTGIDAEGAGEMFNVTRFSLTDLDALPRDPKNKKSLSFDEDYFGKEASLCVTGQLEAECFAMGLGKVYTFGPTFRAENSNTHRHLSEFWMVEPEMAFTTLEQNAELACEFVQFLITKAFERGGQELEAIDNYHRFANKGKDHTSHLAILEKVAKAHFERITYTEAIEILKKSGKKFEYLPDWGKELQTEHERYLTDHHFKSPVIVTDYPKDCKAFYMLQNADGKTVRAMDVLVPGVGEIIGGSQREHDLDRLLKRMDEMHMNREALWWYTDLRRFGSVPHSGFGLGLERILMYLTNMHNIRDVIAFPRTPRNCDF